MAYKKHVFICTNKRENKECCENSCASDIADYAKKKLLKMGLTKESGVRVSTSGCMGRCKEGPTLVIYPEGTWYTYQSKEDIDEIIGSSISKDGVIDRLLLQTKSE